MHMKKIWKLYRSAFLSDADKSLKVFARSLAKNPTNEGDEARRWLKAKGLKLK